MPLTILLPLFGDLGDSILWVPAVRALRVRYPSSRIVALCNPVTAHLLTDLHLIDSAIDADKHIFDRLSAAVRPRSWRVAWQLCRRLRAERFDTVVLFHHLVTRWGALKFAAVALVSGAPHRIGLDNGRGWFLTESVRDRGFGDRHEAQYWLDIAALAGAPGELRLEFPISDADRAQADDLLHTVADRELIAIHPGTGLYGPGRRWPGDNFIGTAKLLHERRGAHFVVLGTRDEADVAQVVVRKLGELALDLVDQTSVGTLGAVLNRCAATIANDGGVAHVSAAVGTPTVVVFGPSNERAWRPIGSTVIAAEIPCRPCFYRDLGRGKPTGCETRECLDFVGPAAVAAAVERLLESSR